MSKLWLILRQSLKKSDRLSARPSRWHDPCRGALGDYLRVLRQYAEKHGPLKVKKLIDDLTADGIITPDYRLLPALAQITPRTSTGTNSVPNCTHFTGHPLLLGAFCNY
jgi:hypothetical protein